MEMLSSKDTGEMRFLILISPNGIPLGTNQDFSAGIVLELKSAGNEYIQCVVRNSVLSVSTKFCIFNLQPRHKKKWLKLFLYGPDIILYAYKNSAVGLPFP